MFAVSAALRAPSGAGGALAPPGERCAHSCCRRRCGRAARAGARRPRGRRRRRLWRAACAPPADSRDNEDGGGPAGAADAAQLAVQRQSARNEFFKLCAPLLEQQRRARSREREEGGERAATEDAPLSSAEQVADAWRSVVCACLYIAQEEQPSAPSTSRSVSAAASSVSSYLRTLDRWCAALARRVRGEHGGGEAAPQLPHVLRVLNEYFFHELRFRAASHEMYYDPRNSLLSEVMDRRQGIPITLSVLYAYLAVRGAGVELHGVNFPSHFLLRRADGSFYIDVFHGGTVLYDDDLSALLARLHHGEGGATRARSPPPLSAAVVNAFKRPADPIDILRRVLRNLKAVYLTQGSFSLALAAADRLLLVDNTDAESRRDRGLINYRLQRREAASTDLQMYLAQSSADAPDRVVVERVLAKLGGEMGL